LAEGMGLVSNLLQISDIRFQRSFVQSLTQLVTEMVHAAYLSHQRRTVWRLISMLCHWATTTRHFAKHQWQLDETSTTRRTMSSFVWK
jgi:hypothetical protein